MKERPDSHTSSLRRAGIILLSVLSGIATGGSIASPYLWPLVFIAPAPFLFLLLQRSTRYSPRSIFYLGLLFGFGLHAVVMGPILLTYPLSWAGIVPGALAQTLVTVAWLCFSIAMALPWGFFALGLRALFKKTQRAAPILIGTILLWVAAEYGSAFFYSLLALGDPVPLSFDFTIGFLGYALSYAPSWLLFPANIGGLPLLSAATILPSATLALAGVLFLERKTMYHLLLPPLLCALMFGALFLFETRRVALPPNISPDMEEELKIVAVRTDFPSVLALLNEEATRRGEEVRAILRDIKETGFVPDIVIFPEAVSFEDYLGDVTKEFKKNLPPTTVVVGTSKRHSLLGETALETRFYEGGGEIVGRIDKELLMPFGEYVPYFFQGLTSILNPKLLENLTANRTYRSGHSLSLSSAHGVPFGARLCSEVFSPRLYRELKEKGAGLLLTLSSAAIFHNSPVFVERVRATARVRAVENGLPMAAVFNGGNPSVYDCNGKEIAPDRAEGNIFLFRLPTSTACSQ